VDLNGSAKHFIHVECLTLPVALNIGRKALNLSPYIAMLVLVGTTVGLTSARDGRIEGPTVGASRSGESRLTFSYAGSSTPPRADTTHHDTTHHDPSSQKTPSEAGAWQDGVWNEITVVQGVQFAYLYYAEADTRNDGVVVRLHNKNECAVTVSFDMLFRPASTPDELGEHVVEERYDLAPGEQVTGENDGLFYIPFPEGENIAEVGLRGVSVQKMCR